MNIHRSIERKKRRSVADSKRIAVIIGGSLIGIALIAGGIVVAKRSSIFTIYSVVVNGIPQAHVEQLKYDLARFSLDHSRISRFLGDRNIIAWDGNPRQFLRVYPQFKDMDIEKDYIAHRIVITVIEREKFGVWCANGNISSDNASSTMPAEHGDEQGCYWFDREGVLFYRAPLVASELFNRVQDFTGRGLSLGDTILPSPEFANLAKIFLTLDAAGVNTRTVYLRDLAAKEVEADSLSDPHMLFSLRFSPDFTLSAIDALRASGLWGKLSNVNFTVENRVSYK